MKHVKLLLVLMCLMALNAQAQTKFCNSYAEYKTNQWKPYADLIPEKEPDSIRVKYDGQDFTLKTSDKNAHGVRNDVSLMILLVLNCSTKVSEKSDMTKSWAARLCRFARRRTFCCSGTYKSY